MAAGKWPGSQFSYEVEVEDLSSQYDPNFHRQMGVEADVVLRVGMMLMGAGTSGYRVLRGMKRSARALGFDHLDANVGLTQITCTFHRGDSFRTVIARTHSPAVDASRIEALEDLTHNHLYSGITAEELSGMLDSIESDVKKTLERVGPIHGGRGRVRGVCVPEFLPSASGRARGAGGIRGAVCAL